VDELSDAITAFLAQHNRNAKRYVWHAKGSARLALTVTAAAQW
jgi:hypothetical protein